jgi:hypothetical protein
MQVITREEYKRNEDLNLHSENALAVVSIFGTDAEKALVKEIVARHQAEGSLDYSDQRVRDMIEVKYYTKMVKTWDHFDNVLGKAVN